MGLFGARVDPRDNLIATLRAELSDLRDQHRRACEQWEADRRELLDRVLALTNPNALRGVRRTPPGEPTAPAKGPRRINYPGTDARVVPPYPPFQPVTPPAGDEDEPVNALYMPTTHGEAS